MPQQAFTKLLEIMNRLRSECPWDRQQTHLSLRQYLLEETYEALDALDSGDDEHLRKELGDVLLQVVFHAEIAAERKQFDIREVIEQLNEKLIRRHPHVFGDGAAETAKDVSQNWESIKKNSEGKESYLDGIPLAMPAMIRAQNIQRKAGAVGFDWENPAQVFAKIKEEVGEAEAEFIKGNTAGVTEEIGDLLFAIVNFLRHIHLNGEDALRQANHKFEQRFRRMEKLLKSEGRDIQKMTLSELDGYWEKIKRTGYET
jgi:MazG family protein